MKAWVHIGTEKTGTTSLQKFLSINRNKLIDQKFYFMKSTGYTNDARLAGYCLPSLNLDFYLFRNEFVNSEVKRQSFDFEFEKNFEKELFEISGKVDNVIFSSEFFHSRLRTDADKQKLKAFLDKYFDEVEIICYLRPQVDVNLSLYSTSLKSGPCTISMEEHLSRCHVDNYYYNYYEILESWKRVFNCSNIIVRLFDKSELLGEDLLKDFCSLCDIEINSLLGIHKENESLTPTGQELLRITNKYLPVFIKNVGLNPLRQAIVKLVSVVCSGSGESPGAELAHKFQSKFDDINERVRLSWFPDRSTLFEINYSKHDKDIYVDHNVVNFFESMLKEICDNGSTSLLGFDNRIVGDLRDAAVMLEDKDIDKSRTLMYLAALLRPDGPYISKKLTEYRS